MIDISHVVNSPEKLQKCLFFQSASYFVLGVVKNSVGWSHPNFVEHPIQIVEYGSKNISGVHLNEKDKGFSCVCQH